jgi:hypothetical protein
MARGKKSGTPFPNTGSEPIPPGATDKAADRPREAGGGPPGSGAGPRHAAGDAGSTEEAYGASESNQPLAESLPEESDALEKGPPYSGRSGGAVGGTPAEDRSSGGRTGHGIAPSGVHRGDSTIGTDADSGTE